MDRQKWIVSPFIRVVMTSYYETSGSFIYSSSKTQELLQSPVHAPSLRNLKYCQRRGIPNKTQSVWLCGVFVCLCVHVWQKQHKIDELRLMCWMSAYSHTRLSVEWESPQKAHTQTHPPPHPQSTVMDISQQCMCSSNYMLHQSCCALIKQWRLIYVPEPHLQ